MRDRGGNLTADSLRDLTMLATGDRDAAEDAWCKRVHEEMRRKG